ncbi:MAG TPA: hypothetical protein ENN28_02915 [Candidatus Uhrbacteria bacterium]|nr:hypothetical protein [Candidatus Uhrbacteria bacterium]
MCPFSPGQGQDLACHLNFAFFYAKIKDITYIMKLSKLQKYILLACFEKKYSKLDRKVLLHFYNFYKKKHSRDIMVNSITVSIDRLIKKGLLVGFGEITKEKIFIDKVRLTRLGREIAKKLLGEQKKLPLKMGKKS